MYVGDEHSHSGLPSSWLSFDCLALDCDCLNCLIYSGLTLGGFLREY